MNSTKSVVGPVNSRKNKLNSKKAGKINHAKQTLNVEKVNKQ